MSAFSHGYYIDLVSNNPRLPIYPVNATVVTDGTDDPATFGYLSDLASPTEAAGPGQGQGIAELVTMPVSGRAWRIAGSHHADVHGVTQAIAAAARLAGVRFAEGVAVTGLSLGAAGVTIACGSGEVLEAEQVVLAPGPWLAAPAWRDLIAPLGLRVKKIVAMHIERRPEPGDAVLLFDADDAFLLPLCHRGHWLFSYTCNEWDVDPDTLTGGLSPADVEAARTCLRRYSPTLAQACQTGRVCCDAYSPAREPVIRILDGTDGRIVFAGAAGGSGYRFGPAIAAQAVARLRGGAGHETTSEGATDDHQYV
jgi:glycine/D-amino acid oxidase-like deaminating enzyme